MRGTIWVTDREPGIRLLFGELLPQADLLDPAEFAARLDRDEHPDALVIDGTQLLELPHRLRADLLRLPRMLVCTGMLLASMPMNLVSGPGVAVLAKPFCVEDLEAAAEWVRGIPTHVSGTMPSMPAIVQRPRLRRRTLPRG